MPFPPDCRRAIAYLKVELPSDAVPTMTLTDGDSPVLRGLGHGLLAAYLVDKGPHFAYVTHGDLERERMSVDALHEHAVANLGALAERDVDVRAYRGVYVVLMGGNFEASLMLFDAFWTDWYANLAPNGFVAVFPARDVLAFCNVADADAVEELRAICTRLEGNADHPLTSTLFLRGDQGWEPFRP